MIIDTHTHLNSEELFKKRDELIRKALSFNVKKMIVVGYDIESSKLALKIAHEYKGIVYATVGIHPEEAIKCEDYTLASLEKMMEDECCIGVGEIGYDFHYDDVPELIQTDFFERQLRMAHRHHLPIMIHMRDATEKTLSLLRANKEYLEDGGIIHGYSGSKESVKDFIDLGFYLSFGGPVTFKNGKKAKEVAAYVPDDRLVVETDCPYMAPDPVRGTRNSSINLKYIIAEIARIKGKTVEETMQMLYNNSRNLYRL